jgi:hypothetical protein
MSNKRMLLWTAVLVYALVLIVVMPTVGSA